ncbi:MAG: four helix bundle protein [Candidatus Paceibacterota bacterium]
MSDKNNKLPLYHKFYQILKFLYNATDNFEKQYKYSLGEDILELTWKCMDLVIEANALTKKKKSKTIKKLSITFDQLKIRLRMAQELEQLSKGQYSHLQTEYMKEAGKMIGGWSNAN